MVEPVDLALGLRLGLQQHKGETPHLRPNQKTTPGVYNKNLKFFLLAFCDLPRGGKLCLSFLPAT